MQTITNYKKDAVKNNSLKTKQNNTLYIVLKNQLLFKKSFSGFIVHLLTVILNLCNLANIQKA